MTDSITPSISDAITAISRAFLADDSVPGHDLDERLQAYLRKVGRGVFQTVVEARSAELVALGKAEGLVTQHRRKVKFYTVFGPVSVGPVSVESPYMWCAVDRFGWRPLREAFGIADKARSRRLERALVDFGSDRSFAKAARGFEEHYGWTLGRTTIRSATLAEATRAEVYLERVFAAAAELFNEPAHGRRRREHLVAELDGCMIRTGKLVGAHRAARLDLPADQMVRKETWREVRTGLVRGLDQVDPTYACGIKSYEEITDEMFGAACRHGLTDQTQVVAPSDGAFGLKEALEARFPRLQFILDFVYLKGHVYETAEAMGLSDGVRQRWAEALLDEIWRGDVQTVIARLESHLMEDASPRMRRLVEYLERFSGSVDTRDSLRRVGQSAREKSRAPTGSFRKNGSRFPAHVGVLRT